MRIRPAEEKDLDTLAEMALEFETYLMTMDDTFISDVPPKKRFRRVLKQGLGDDKHRMVIALIEGNVVGFADYWAYPEALHGGLSGYLNNIYVREDYRGKGLGTRIMDHLIQDAKERGVVAMHVPVLAKNGPAVEFYEKLGGFTRNIMYEICLEDK